MGAEAMCGVVQAVSAAAARQTGLTRSDSIQPPHVGKHHRGSLQSWPHGLGSSGLALHSPLPFLL